MIGKVGGALFLDYGNTFISPKDFSFDKLAVSAGFGLRYYTDIIPLRVDFAFKLQDPDDSRSLSRRISWDMFQVHIGIGEAF